VIISFWSFAGLLQITPVPKALIERAAKTKGTQKESWMKK